VSVDTAPINPGALQGFWSWFVENEEKIRKAYDADSEDLLVALISPALSEVSDRLGWELGPYALPNYSFVISPECREDVALARRVAEAAPEIDCWTIFCGKPPKDLTSLTFEVAGREICCDDWRYRMTSYNRGEFVDLEIFFEEANAPPAGEEMVVCELAVEALVGQAVSLERVGDIEHCLVSSAEEISKTSPMRHLKEHLERVLSPYQ
jgi:hypothetical protein